VVYRRGKPRSHKEANWKTTKGIEDLPPSYVCRVSWNIYAIFCIHKEIGTFLERRQFDKHPIYLWNDIGRPCSFIHVSSWFYPDLIQILSRFYPNFILIFLKDTLSKFYPNFWKNLDIIWKKYYPDFILILSRFFRSLLYQNVTYSDFILILFRWNFDNIRIKLR
jgi:hypothetical protein